MNRNRVRRIAFVLAAVIIRLVEWLIGNIDPKKRKPEQILVSELRKQRVCFRAEYSEANESTELIVEYEGAAFDLENAENQLALRLIRNAVSELCGERSEGGELPNRIRMRVRS